MRKNARLFATAISCLCILVAHAEENAPPEESLPEEAIAQLDNTPSACVGMLLISDGLTIEEFYKKNPAECDATCKASIASMKESETRSNLARSTKELGGVNLPGDYEKNRYRVDGPANLRDAPNGKVIGSFPHEFVVLAEGQKGDWLRIRGYWERVCETGWTHRKNLVAVTRAELEKRDLLSSAERIALKEKTKKAFQEYFKGEKSRLSADEAAKDALEFMKKSKFDYQHHQATEGRHLLSQLRGRIALEEGNLKKAAAFLLDSADIDAVGSYSMYGPATELALQILKKGEKESVIRFLEKSKKFWTKSLVKDPPPAASSRIVDRPSPLPDQWISAIRAGKTPEMNEMNQLAGIWQASSWK